jgi:bifunctional ADP-heptose synthase (sugar kinase/adenylyltransferase)
MANMLVVGDVMLDILIEGGSSRAAPDAPWAPVIRAPAPRTRLGGAGFVASVLRRLGHDVCLVCAIADDWVGELVALAAANEGIHLLGGQSDVTTLKISVVHERPTSYVPLCRGDVDATTAEFPSHIVDDQLPADALICADYGKGVFLDKGIQALLARYQCPRIADPKPPGVAVFRGFDVLVPNEQEAETLLGRPLGSSPKVACAELESRLGCHNILITRNGNGVVSRDDVFCSAAEWTGHTVRSVSGAGDVFTATLADRLLGAGLRFAALTAEREARYYVHTGRAPTP